MKRRRAGSLGCLLYGERISVALSFRGAKRFWVCATSKNRLVLRGRGNFTLTLTQNRLAPCWRRKMEQSWAGSLGCQLHGKKIRLALSALGAKRFWVCATSKKCACVTVLRGRGKNTLSLTQNRSAPRRSREMKQRWAGSLGCLLYEEKIGEALSALGAKRFWVPATSKIQLVLRPR